MKLKITVLLASFLMTSMAYGAIELPVPPKNLSEEAAEKWFKSEYTAARFQNAGLLDPYRVCRYALYQMYYIGNPDTINLNENFEQHLYSQNNNLVNVNAYRTFRVCEKIVSEFNADNINRGLELVRVNLDETYDDTPSDQWRFASPATECPLTIASYYPDEGHFAPTRSISSNSSSNEVKELINYCENKIETGNQKALTELTKQLAQKIVDGETLPSNITHNGIETRQLKFRNADEFFVRNTVSNYTNAAIEMAKPALNAKIRDVIDAIIEDDTNLVLSSDFEKFCPFKSDINNAWNGNDTTKLCKQARDSVASNRSNHAYARSNAEAITNKYQMFGFTLPNGDFQRVNLKQFIGGAAIDGFQIEFVEEKGWLSSEWKAKIHSIDALNYEGGKTVNAILKPSKREDGVQVIQITSIDSIDDFHGPSEVLGCLTTPQDTFNNVAENQFLSGMIGSVFGADKGTETLIDSYYTVENLKACLTAKKTVLGTPKAS